jgi:hypothetical protein
MLERCPQCSYSLSGLPTKHACPECGLRYDERSEVWRAQWDRYGRSYALAIIIPSCTFIPVGLVQFGLDDSFGSLFFAVLLFGLLVGLFIHMRIGQGRPRMAVLPDGLFILSLIGKPRLIPWSQIADAKHSNGLGVTQVRLNNGRRISVRWWCMPSPVTAEFAALIRSRAK